MTDEPTPAEKPDSENDKLARNMRIAAYELPLILEAAAAALSAAPGEREGVTLEAVMKCVEEHWCQEGPGQQLGWLRNLFASPPVPADKGSPQTELGKLLTAIVQSVGTTDPRAFIEVDIAKAIQQADLAAGGGTP